MRNIEFSSLPESGPDEKHEENEPKLTRKIEFDIEVPKQKQEEVKEEYKSGRKIEFTPRTLEEEPVYKKLLEQESLEYLKTKDSDWFYDNYTGELSPEGYLIDKDGKETNFLPSQNIMNLKEVEEKVLLILRNEYPNLIKKHNL